MLLMKYLCFDPGLAHTGVAISEEGELVEPLTTISTPDRLSLLAKVQNLISLHQPDLTVIGDPGRGPITELSTWLSQELSQHGHQVELAEEGLSTQVANKHLQESRLSIKKRHTRQHQAAAAVILQSYLDTLE